MGAIIYVIFGLINAILTLRLVFRFSGANPENGFVNLIYGLSAPIVSPFAGILGQPVVVEGAVVAGVFEWATVIAIIVVAIVGGLAVRLVNGSERGRA